MRQILKLCVRVAVDREVLRLYHRAERALVQRIRGET